MDDLAGLPRSAGLVRLDDGLKRFDFDITAKEEPKVIWVPLGYFGGSPKSSAGG